MPKAFKKIIDYIKGKNSTPLEPNHDYNATHPITLYKIGTTNFNDPKQQIILEYYDITDDYLQNAGCNLKDFYLASSDLFEELFDPNKNNSYSTYMDDLIDSGDKMHHISVLCKSTGAKYANSEIVSSRILNYFHIPTVFNTLAITQYEDVYDTLMKDVLSVDFMRPQDEFQSFVENGEMGSIESWFKAIEHYVGLFYKHNKQSKATTNEAKQQKVDSLKRDFVQTYLYRRILLDDHDFFARNFGVIMNKEDIRLAPNFDMECSLEIYRSEGLDQDLIKCYYLYPDLVDDFITNINKANANHENNTSILQNIINSACTSKQFAKEFNSQLCYNIDEINVAYSKAKNRNIEGEEYEQQS